MYFNYVTHRDYKVHSLCFMGIATLLLLYYYNNPPTPPLWNVFQYWPIANIIGGILWMLLLVKINGRIDMFFVKRKTIAFPLLHLNSYHIIISCHAYACWCDEHQCVEWNVFGAPNMFFLFFFLREGNTSLLWFKNNVKVCECSLSFLHNWVLHYKVICRDPLEFYEVKASPPLVGNMLARTTLRVSHNVV